MVETEGCSCFERTVLTGSVLIYQPTFAAVLTLWLEGLIRLVKKAHRELLQPSSRSRKKHLCPGGQLSIGALSSEFVWPLELLARFVLGRSKMFQRRSVVDRQTRTFQFGNALVPEISQSPGYGFSARADELREFLMGERMPDMN